MKKHLLSLSVLSLVLMTAMLLIVSCGGGDNNPDPLNVTGIWLIVSNASADLTATLTHTGTAITGTVTDAANYAVTIGGTSVMPAGSTSGSRNVSLTVTFNDGLWARFDGSVNDNNTLIRGTYTDSQGNTGDPFTAQRQ
jgi:hypothetical protein